MSKIDPKRIVSVESPGMLRVRKVIEDAKEPIDGKTVAKLAHVSFNTFAHTYRHLLVRAGLIHIAGWRNNFRGPFVPLYLSGPLIGDPPQLPPKLDHKIAVRAWKARTGYYEAEKSKRRLARPPDTALAALMGLTPRYHRKNTTTPASPAERNTA